MAEEFAVFVIASEINLWKKRYLFIPGPCFPHAIKFKQFIVIKHNLLHNLSQFGYSLPISLNKKMNAPKKILVAGDVCGQFGNFFTKVSQLNQSKAGDYIYLLLI